MQRINGTSVPVIVQKWDGNIVFDNEKACATSTEKRQWQLYVSALIFALCPNKEKHSYVDYFFSQFFIYCFYNYIGETSWERGREKKSAEKEK